MGASRPTGAGSSCCCALVIAWMLSAARPPLLSLVRPGTAGLSLPADGGTARAQDVVVLVRLVQRVEPVGHHPQRALAGGTREAHRQGLARLHERERLLVGRGAVDEQVDGHVARLALAAVRQVDAVELGARAVAGATGNARDREIRQLALLTARARGALGAAQHPAARVGPAVLHDDAVDAALVE